MEKVELNLEKQDIQLLGLPARIVHSLTFYGKITTIEALLSKSDEELLKIRDVGKKSLSDIKTCVHQLGLKFDSETLSKTDELKRRLKELEAQKALLLQQEAYLNTQIAEVLKEINVSVEASRGRSK